MAAPAYSVIGPYKHGVWLVVLPDGAAAIMDRALLPAYKKGTEYYWLGATPDKAVARIPRALGELSLDVSTYPSSANAILPAFQGKRIGISGDWGAPGGPGPQPGTGTPPTAPTVPGASYATGGTGGPLGFLGSIGDSIGSTADFLKWIAWIFHPLNLLRAVEFITGIATMFYGISTLLGVMRRGSATHRTTLRSVFNWTPIGRELKFAGARRRGKRAGEIQSERDVAYRGARQKRARQTGAGKRTTPGSGGTGGTGKGSSDRERALSIPVAPDRDYL